MEMPAPAKCPPVQTAPAAVPVLPYWWSDILWHFKELVAVAESRSYDMKNTSENVKSWSLALINISTDMSNFFKRKEEADVCARACEESVTSEDIDIPTGVVPLLEKLEVVVESLSYEVKRISEDVRSASSYLLNIKACVSNMLKEKRQANVSGSLYSSDRTVSTTMNAQEAPVSQTDASRNENSSSYSRDTDHDYCLVVDDSAESCGSLSASKDSFERTNQMLEVDNSKTPHPIIDNSFCSEELQEHLNSPGSVRPKSKQVLEETIPSNASVYSENFTRTFGASRTSSSKEKETERKDEEYLSELSLEVILAEENMSGLNIVQGDNVAEANKVSGGDEKQGFLAPSTSSGRHGNETIRKRSFSCKICGKNFPSNCHVKRHEIVHSGERPFKCTMCANTFSQKGNLLTHMRIHTNEKPFICTFCQKSFRQKKDLNIHMRAHIGEMQYMCEQCGQVFATNDAITEHMHTHTGAQPFSCPECEQSFSTSNNLHKHRLQEHKISDTKFDVCHSSTSRDEREDENEELVIEQNVEVLLETEDDPEFNEDSLAEEKEDLGGQGVLARSTSAGQDRSKPIRERPFCCETCGKCFTSSSLLKMHQRGHTEENPFECPVCKHTFTQKSSLLVHSRSHSNEKPFICTICRKSFSQSSHFKYHMRIHSGDKPYQCQDCEKTFARSDSLTVHMRTHSGERPYCCPECGKRCTMSSNLRKHMLSVHKICNSEIVVSRSTSSKPMPTETEDSEACVREQSSEVPMETEDGLEFDDVTEDTIAEEKESSGEDEQQDVLARSSPSELQGNKDTIAEEKESSGEDEQQDVLARRSPSELQGNKSISERKFYCNVCGKCFTSSSRLKVHRKAHAGKKQLECHVCKYVFTQKSSLLVHMRIHSGEKPFICNICRKSFRQRSQFNYHMRVHSGEKPYECQECGRTFARKDFLTAHTRTHSGERPYPCPECGKRCAILSNLRKHMRKVHKICDAKINVSPTFKSRPKETETEDPAEHVTEQSLEVILEAEDESEFNDLIEDTIVEEEENIGDGEQQGSPVLSSSSEQHGNKSIGKTSFCCKTCGKCFKSSIPLMVHQKIHTDKKQFACQVCRRTFTRKSSMLVHMQQHSNEKPFICTVCQKSFRQKSYLKYHMRVHSGDKPYKCKECGKAFARKDFLTLHMRIHSGERPYLCPECGISSSSSSNLRKHRIKVHKIRSTNIGDSPPSESTPNETEMGDNGEHVTKQSLEVILDAEDKCELNDEMVDTARGETEVSAEQEGFLEPGTSSGQHEEKAIEELTFCCATCGKCFKSSSHLMTHQKIHSDKKQFECPVCKYVFTQKSSLLVHMRIHSDEKPFVCDICGKSFRQRSHFKYHMRVHDGDKPYKCQQCHKTFVRKDFLTIHSRTHSGERPFLCPECGKRCSTSSNLLKHRVNIHKIRNPEFGVPHTSTSILIGNEQHDVEQSVTMLLGTQFGCKLNVLTEGTIAEEDLGGGEQQGSDAPSTSSGQHGKKTIQRFFDCKTCGKCFKTSSLLKIHQAVHMIEKPFECSVCKHTFSQKGNLLTHMRVHTDEKPFPCTICEKTFRQKEHLTNHMRNHTGEKPYKCKECGRTYARNGSLTTHMHTHRAERPFCTDCQKYFSTMNSLRRHGEKVHEALFLYPVKK